MPSLYAKLLAYPFVIFLAYHMWKDIKHEIKMQKQREANLLRFNVNIKITKDEDEKLQSLMIYNGFDNESKYLRKIIKEKLKGGA